jgi:hypothetical protein
VISGAIETGPSPCYFSNTSLNISAGLESLGGPNSAKNEDDCAWVTTPYKRDKYLEKVYTYIDNHHCWIEMCLTNVGAMMQMQIEFFSLDSASLRRNAVK